MTQVTPPIAPCKVLVVDDSTLQRRIIATALSASGEIEVVGQAASAEEAHALCRALLPDVITMDLQMPGGDGLVASERILAERGVPIVLLTASATEEDQVLVANAFAAGVLAVLPKPQFVGNDAASHELQRTVAAYAKVRVMRRPQPGARQGHHPMPSTPTPLSAQSAQRPTLSPKLGQAATQPPAFPYPSLGSGRSRASGRVLHPQAPELIAIGASTGGPQVLLELLAALPPDFAVPMVVVQHIVPGFTNSLTTWLGSALALPVALAQDGQGLRSGVCFAPSGQHLVARAGAGGGLGLHFEDDAPYRGHRPAVGKLFGSLAPLVGRGKRVVAVLLTGMGDDGAAGLLALRQAGAVTVAQDEASCIIFGMPGAAVRLGAAQHVLPPARIAALLLRLADGGMALGRGV
jgi:two-component system, chemotaxis family, protein-glutamate methylesterase/glutaminase